MNRASGGDREDTKAIHVGKKAWVAADISIAPGVSIGRGAVVGARSSVFHDLPEGMVAVGSPARIIGRREYHGDSTPQDTA